NDVKLLKFALSQESIPGRFVLVQDGQEVLDYLKGEKNYVNRQKFPFPDLIILDLNMPRLNGMDVLRWIRSHTPCARVPVVMLSGSGLEKDIEEAYDLGVNSYFRKPGSVAALAALLKTLARYWQSAQRPILHATSTAPAVEVLEGTPGRNK